MPPSSAGASSLAGAAAERFRELDTRAVWFLFEVSDDNIRDRHFGIILRAREELWQPLSFAVPVVNFLE
jgi:hypothetical protein